MMLRLRYPSLLEIVFEECFMIKLLSSSAIASAVLVLGLATPAHALSNRAWVSRPWSRLCWLRVTRIAMPHLPICARQHYLAQRRDRCARPRWLWRGDDQQGAQHRQ